MHVQIPIQNCVLLFLSIHKILDKIASACCSAVNSSWSIDVVAMIETMRPNTSHLAGDDKKTIILSFGFAAIRDVIAF